jgi:spore germination protein KB
MIWAGLEAIGRIGTLAFSTACFFYFVVFLSSIPEFELKRVLPLFDSGVASVLKASLTADSFTGTVQIVLAMILPMVANQKKAFRSSAAGMAIGGSFFVFYFIAELMVMGPELVALMRIASMDFVRSIQITKYLHRFESFMVALWYWSILVQAGILAYCAMKAFMQTVGIKKKNPYVAVVFIILIGAVSYYIGYNRVFFLNFREFTWEYISIPFQFILPVILLIVMFIKKSFAKNDGK